MPYGLYISAEGAQVQSRRLEVISNNLANVETTGFKRDLALFQARYAEETARGRDYPGSRSVNDLGGGVRITDTQTDFSPGVLERTGVKEDLAIRGEGFFVVRKGDEQLLTRAGNFVLTPEGQLKTQTGHAVMSESGGPIAIDPALPWTVTPDGAIEQEGTLQRLALVRTDSLGDLAKAGENAFVALAPTRPLAAGERDVAGGYLEGSGVKPTTAMMEMIEASRAFEANVNLIRSQDQMLGGLIGRILKA